MLRAVAILRNVAGGKDHPIAASCIVGRGPSCGLRIDEQFASSEHAKLVWTGNSWNLRDLGSRNGTFVDGKRLEPGKPHRLAPGAKIGFGDTDGWEFTDDAAPGALAIDLESHEVRAGVGELLVLPGDDNPSWRSIPAMTASDGSARMRRARRRPSRISRS